MPPRPGLPPSRLVSVQIQIAQPGVQGPGVNSAVFMGNSHVINPTERMRHYGSLDEVAAQFQQGTPGLTPPDPEYSAAVAWFSQQPQPQSLYIARWVDTIAPARLVGDYLPALGLGTGVFDPKWPTIINGGFTVTIDGTVHVIGPMDFSSVTSMEGVEQIIQQGFVTATSTATFEWLVYNGSHRWELISGVTTTGSAVSFLTAPTTGTDISGMLYMKGDPSDEAYIVPRHLIETATDALVDIDNKYPGAAYGVFCEAAPQNELTQLAAYCEAADPKHYAGFTSTDPATLNPLAGDTTSLAAMLAALGYNKSAVQWTRAKTQAWDRYCILSYLARILTVDWTGRNTALTLMWKQEPGVTSELLTFEQADALQSKHCNVYCHYTNDSDIIEYGTSASGVYTDTVIGADSLAYDIQTALWNVLYTTPTKIPQTDPGLHLLHVAATEICDQYRINGYLGVGEWNGPAIGRLVPGRRLGVGFYVYLPSILEQSEGDRATRAAPLMQIAAQCAGAIHEASVLITIEQ